MCTRSDYANELHRSVQAAFMDVAVVEIESQFDCRFHFRVTFMPRENGTPYNFITGMLITVPRDDHRPMTVETSLISVSGFVMYDSDIGYHYSPHIYTTASEVCDEITRVMGEIFPVDAVPSPESAETIAPVDAVPIAPADAVGYNSSSSSDDDE